MTLRPMIVLALMLPTWAGARAATAMPPPDETTCQPQPDCRILFTPQQPAPPTSMRDRMDSLTTMERARAAPDR